MEYNPFKLKNGNWKKNYKKLSTEINRGPKKEKVRKNPSEWIFIPVRFSFRDLPKNFETGKMATDIH